MKITNDEDLSKVCDYFLDKRSREWYLYLLGSEGVYYKDKFIAKHVP